MDISTHFGLKKAPFMEAVDSEACLASPVHREALATLRYTIRDHKACAMVIGGCGMGKTLVGRLASKSCQNRRPVLWVHGLAQSDNSLAVTVLAGSRGKAKGDTSPQPSTLAEWCAEYPQRSPAPVVIVDEADELTTAHWTEFIALLAQDMRFTGQMTLILLGTPKLRDRLASPQFARLRRRVFRICSLRPMTVEESLEYVGIRVANAGGDAKQLFETEALEKIARLTRGNPSLINVLCDNTLIEAYGADRTRVTLDDVRSAVEAMIGITHTHTGAHVLSAPEDVTLALPMSATEPETTQPVTEPVVEPATEPVSQPEESITFERRLAAMRSRLERTLAAVRDVSQHVDEATGISAATVHAIDVADTDQSETPDEILAAAG
ncbi:MAG: AAA family ATPase [Phycisphaerae bacterium]|nr:AAA family ATPase [Phycisphaerae bacterium]